MDRLLLISFSQWVSRVSGAGMLLLAALVAIQTLVEGSFRLDSIIIASILLVFGSGLVKCWKKAKQLLAAVLLFSAIVTPIGIINPFHAGDQIAHFGQASSVAEILIWLIPLEISLLAVAWLLELPAHKKIDSN